MRILEELENCRTIGISGHENPDGDCAGACLGLMLFLEKALPDARVDVFLESLPAELHKNIPGSDRVITDFKTDVDRYDAFVVLDSAKDRIAGAEAFFDNAVRTVNIDHHISNPGSAGVNYIDGTASSACELVYEVIDRDLLDPDIARALYVGIVTDTGCFRFSSTSRKTMEIAGDLMTFGFDFSTIVREVYFEKTFVQQKILGRALLTSKSCLHGRCIVSSMDQAAIRSCGGVGKDVEGIVSALVSTTGADCAFFAHERTNGEWRVSMRSNNIVDVAAIAQVFGGGGHFHASGCTIKADQSFDASLRKMLDMASAQLNAQPDRA